MVSHRLAKLIVRRPREHSIKARREGRMFIDYLRNGQSATAICPWSLRARAGGSVAVPVGWDELQSLDRANAFDIFSAAERMAEPDPWVGYLEVTQTLTDRVREVVRLA